MPWFVHAGGRRVALVAEVQYSVGRATDADVVLGGPRLSRAHLAVTVGANDSEWRIEDRSSHGTYSTDGRIRSLAGDEPAAVALGSPDGPLVVLTQAPQITPEETATLARRISIANTTSAETGGAGELDGSGPGRGGLEVHATRGEDGAGAAGAAGDRIRIGRGHDNDVVVPGLLASPHHAVIVRSPAGWELLDLDSARGTFVNGERVRLAVLTPGDDVSLGGSTFTFTGSELLARAAEGGVPVGASGITVRAGAATLLQDISFHAEPRTVTAIIGPSGSGKSTLLNAMTGLRPATSGQVLVDGADFYSRYEEMRFWVGAVPQADLVPAQLRVRDALEYAARLRFPSDTSKQARSARVAEVMEELGLSARADLRIDRLSGGQRKRVSVALELLTKPRILYLDEPTSGLDPGLDRQVMMLLRELADGGRTVFVVTHAVENLALADRLIVLAAGGWLAYDGPPGEVTDYFNVADMPSVFTSLDSTPGSEWAARWARRPRSRVEAPRSPDATARQAPVAQPVGAARLGRPPHSTQDVTAKPVGGVSQLPTLIARNVKAILADPGYLSFLVLLPLLLGLAGALVGSPDGLGPGPSGLNPEARSVLLVIVLGCIFTGAATSIQELVKERVIYQRERAVGLSRAAYVGSKAIVLGAIAAFQGFVFATLTLLGRPGPADPLVLPGHLEITVVAALAALCAAMIGLAISAVLPSREMAMPVLVVLTIVAVILSGAIPLRLDWVVDLVGWTMASSWQFTAMASSVDLSALLGPAAGAEEWPHVASEYLSAVGVLAAMSAAFLLLAIHLTGRHDPGRR